MQRVLPDGKGNFSFDCPGCGYTHVIGSGWGFNGNVEIPTFTPSLLVRSGHYCSHHKDGDDCWCTFNKKRVAEGHEPSRFECSVCHSFITDGRIQFLSDCTHKLAGQTVDLPDFEP